MKLSEGLVIGGPMDGKHLSSKSHTFRVATAPSCTTRYISHSEEDHSVRIDYMDYRYVGVDGVGFWVPEEVAEKGVWAYKTYDSVYQYIFQTLASNYRPSVGNG